MRKRNRSGFTPSTEELHGLGQFKTFYIWQHQSGVDQGLVGREPLLHLVGHETVDEQDGQVAIAGQGPAQGPAVLVLEREQS